MRENGGIGEAGGLLNLAEDYDQKYDMAAGDLARPPFADAASDCDEKRCESRDSNSDARGRQILSLAAADSPPTSTPTDDPLSATTRQPAAPAAAESTTDCATSDPAPAKPIDWIPIAARTPESCCKSCDQVVYWGYTRLGRPVPISIKPAGSIAPTRHAKGQGISHFIDCPTRDQHRTAKRPRQTELL